MLVSSTGFLRSDFRWQKPEVGRRKLDVGCSMLDVHLLAVPARRSLIRVQPVVTETVGFSEKETSAIISNRSCLNSAFMICKSLVIDIGQAVQACPGATAFEYVWSASKPMRPSDRWNLYMIQAWARGSMFRVGTTRAARIKGTVSSFIFHYNKFKLQT